jgi:DNA repair protein RadC
VKRALNHAAAALVFIHNHLSGNPKPSQDDITITKKLKEATEAIDVSVHDHLIIVGNEVYSCADNSLI